MKTTMRWVGAAAVLGLAVAALPGVATSAAGAEGAPYVLATSWHSGDYAPDGIEVGPQGVVTVSSTGGKVRTFSPDGALLSTFGISFLTDARGLGIDGAGNIYLSDFQNDADLGVRVYSPTGTPLRNFGGADISPRGLDIDASGNVYVADPANSVVWKYNAAGALIDTIGGFGNLPGQLDRPKDVAIAPDGTIVVADQDNNRVQRFSASGDFISAFGQAGNGPGFITEPNMIDVTPQGRVIVGEGPDTLFETGVNRVQVFDLEGQFHELVNTTMDGLSALAVGPDGAFYLGGWLRAADGSGTTSIGKFVPTAPAPTPTPTPTAAPTPTPTPTPVLVKGVGVVADKVLRVKKKRLSLTLRCASQARGGCTGSVLLRSRPSKGGSAKSDKLTKAVAYDLRAGTSAKVRTKLTKRGVRVLRQRAVTKAVAISSAANLASVKTKVKIRR